METDDMSLRVASFSYYLDTAKDNSSGHHKISSNEKTESHTLNSPPFSIKISKPQENDIKNTKNLRSTTNFTFSRQTLPKDDEIGVFKADKYFNMNLEYKTEPKTMHESKVSGPNVINTNTNMTSSCSEAGSWNSQTALMPPGKNFGQTTSSEKPKRLFGRRIFTGLGCNGPCFDKNSVRVHLGVPKVTKNGHHSRLTKDEPRKSIEVFGSNKNAAKNDVATDMERKLSMLTWDAIPIIHEKTVEVDMASEASSDLFEIENISGRSVTFSPRGLAVGPTGDDEAECMNYDYAPSEASSIQWSVVTASAAANYSSVNLSDFNDESVSLANKSSKKVDEVKKKGRLSVGINLGCKNQKAVEVAAENNVVGPKMMMSCHHVEKSKLISQEMK
ncbi:phytochrome kinase substrate [Striga asiatica]|uniref:Phytochrome kinase substrate n=1 Tax=Striga asiatica TaxID=4170 RepID=A0A5A7R6R9_STRAF|nr:phytochrome kinase substrate [Striga asiatica]